MKTCDLLLHDKKKVAHGRVYGPATASIHNVPLEEECYRVSVDEVINANAFLPYETADAKHVGEALASFVAWPKNLVVLRERVFYLLCYLA